MYFAYGHHPPGSSGPKNSHLLFENTIPGGAALKCDSYQKTTSYIIRERRLGAVYTQLSLAAVPLPASLPLVLLGLGGLGYAARRRQIA